MNHTKAGRKRSFRCRLARERAARREAIEKRVIHAWVDAYVDSFFGMLG